MNSEFDSIDAVVEGLTSVGYVCDRSLATSVFLASRMQRPLLLEGEAGVGKTEIAKALSALTGRPLIRLQCYEGLDVSAAVYEWAYARQMMAIRLAEAQGAEAVGALASNIYAPEYLVKRPLLQALEPGEGGTPILLIDELDRTDEPFEAFLLEILSDFQVTVPELGTLKAEVPPMVIVTSNRTREIHDALKRRCLYHWVDYPTIERELEIVNAKVPQAPQALTAELVRFIAKLRQDRDLFKNPGVAETLDWADALAQLDQLSLNPAAINDTLGVLLKYQDDIEAIRGTEAAQLLEEVRTDLKRQNVQSAV